MKKIIPLIIFALTATIWAEDPGVQAQVELLSGTRQKARFLGIQNDTVSLGGYIQNQFTIIKIAKSQFKKIVDEQGNDLLNGRVETQKTAKAPDAQTVQPIQTKGSTAKEASVTPKENASQTPAESQVSTDTTAATSNDSIAAQGKTSLVTFEFKNGDSTIATQITALSARLLLENGEKPQIYSKNDFPDCDDNICIQNRLYSSGFSTIYFGNIQNIVKTDSLDISLTRVFYEDSLPTLHKSQMTLSNKNFLNDAITGEKMKYFILNAQEKRIENKTTKAYIHIETDPDGATISRSEKNTICKSPCTFAIRDTGKIALHAFWKVDQHLWGATTNIIPILGDTVKTSLKLKKISPEIRIITQPDNAEIYEGDTKITKHSKPIAKTPNKVRALDMGFDSLLIRKPGFRDTTISFYVAPVPQLDLNIDLEKITDFNEIEEQQKWLHDRKMLHIGQGLIGGALGSAIIGALFLYFAHIDYDDADNIKSQLRTPGSLQGKNFQKKVKKNHDLVKHGKQKTVIGSSLLGVSAALLGFGLYFVF